jgi:uncharacterized hydrophobic protein (TIGR00271 family)
MTIDSLKRRFHARFDLRLDQADLTEIDTTFRSAVEFRGTNLWVLIFAILIASIGLNVNSTAVIIGAMLISPLMGPIMAVGYGAGINDSELMRASLFNLGLAALISLLTSTVYFAITPLTLAHSELLARTTPSIWDVLIALFGGLAGAIGATRQIKSNLIPGVAIATALMPPLCTAGYGLAVGNWEYFFGAFYLFAINCVFIALATLMMVRVMRIPSIKVLEDRSVLKRRTLIGMVVVLTLVPSLFLAFNLVQREWFNTNAGHFVQQVLRAKTNVLVVSQEPDYKLGVLRVNLVGDRLSDSDIQAMEQRLPEFGLPKVKLLVAQSGQPMPDMNLVKRELLTEFMQSNRTDVAQREARIVELERELQIARNSASTQVPLKDIYREVSAQFPQAKQLSVTWGLQSAVIGPASVGASTEIARPDRALLLVQLQLPSALGASEQERLRLGLRARAGLSQLDEVQLFVSVLPTARSASKRK